MLHCVGKSSPYSHEDLYQFFAFFCSATYMEYIINILQALAPDSLHIDHAIRELLEEGR